MKQRENYPFIDYKLARQINERNKLHKRDPQSENYRYEHQTIKHLILKAIFSKIGRNLKNITRSSFKDFPSTSKGCSELSETL